MQPVNYPLTYFRALNFPALKQELKRQGFQEEENFLLLSAPSSHVDRYHSSSLETSITIYLSPPLFLYFPSLLVASFTT